MIGSLGRRCPCSPVTTVQRIILLVHTFILLNFLAFIFSRFKLPNEPTIWKNWRCTSLGWRYFLSPHAKIMQPDRAELADLMTDIVTENVQKKLKSWKSWKSFDRIDIYNLKPQYISLQCSSPTLIKFCIIFSIMSQPQTAYIKNESIVRLWSEHPL